MKLRVRHVMEAFLLLMVLLAGGAGAFLQQEKFGDSPDEQSRLAIETSPHQKDGVFENLTPTPMFREGDSFATVMWQNMTNRPEHLAPEQPLPSVKLDLKALPIDQDTLVWLGHSSYYLHLAGQRILIDPVFSDHAAPVSFANRAFAGSTPYSADDMPPVDLLLITHDHWDHLDYDTLTALAPRIKRVITGLGVGSHLVSWGFPKDIILEGDWTDHFDVNANLAVHVLPARHYSGRALQRNRTLWAAFALITPERRWFFSGDSGYGTHFRAIGEQFKGFDLVALDSGQYDERWPLIHMTPEEATQAAEDLQAKAFMPAHVGRFAMARHAWNEPLERVVKASEERAYRLLLPVIGDAVRLTPEAGPIATSQSSTAAPPWWTGLR